VNESEPQLSEMSFGSGLLHNTATGADGSRRIGRAANNRY